MMEEKKITNREVYELKREARRQEQEKIERKQAVKKWVIRGVVLLFVLGVGFGIFKLVTAPSSLFKSTSSENILTIKQDDWTKGNKNAPVVLIEYLDFECEACRSYFPLIKELQGEFGNDLLVATRYFPLPGHKNSMEAAIAVEAAGKQGKYWEMYDILFESQSEWSEKKMADAKLFATYAQEIGLNMAKFEEDRKNPLTKSRVERDRAEGVKLGITGTPSFFLNGEKIQNPKSPEDFKTLIQAAKLKSPAPDASAEGEKIHEHADFAVYLEGKKIDFTLQKYQSSETNPLNENAHLHDGNGQITHKHQKGITLGYFFETIGIQFDDQCFVLDNGRRYCNNDSKKLRMYVNGTANNQFGAYEFSDLDKILISYGSETQAISQINSVSDEACIYSDKCPERGTPPTENCVGGLGSEC